MSIETTFQIEDSTLQMIQDGTYHIDDVAKRYQMHPQKVREAIADYKQRQANLDHLASLIDSNAPPAQRHILDGFSDCVKILETLSTSIGEHISAAFAVPEVSRADESANAEKQHITDILQIQALFLSWGVKLEPCHSLGGYLVKGNGDDAFFLTEPTIENIIVLRKAKVEKSRIKKVLENAGVDFKILIQIETPVTPETQLQKTVFEAVQNALAVEVVR